jgi:hypothetical protein
MLDRQAYYARRVLGKVDKPVADPGSTCEIDTAI